MKKKIFIFHNTCLVLVSLLFYVHIVYVCMIISSLIHDMIHIQFIVLILILMPLLLLQGDSVVLKIPVHGLYILPLSSSSTLPSSYMYVCMYISDDASTHLWLPMWIWWKRVSSNSQSNSSVWIWTWTQQMRQRLVQPFPSCGEHLGSYGSHCYVIVICSLTSRLLCFAK
jgi:hypothetical protein